MGRHNVRYVFMAAVVILAAIIQYSPMAQAAFQFDRPAVVSWQVWRIITGNFVHYSWVHFFSNVGAFAVLFLIVGRGATRVTLVSAVATCTGVFLGATDILVYRGISGVCYGLIAYALVFRPSVENGGKTIVFNGILWLAIVFWLGYEKAASHTRLPFFLPESIEVTVASHVSGLAAGTLMAVISGNSLFSCIPEYFRRLDITVGSLWFHTPKVHPAKGSKAVRSQV